MAKVSTASVAAARINTDWRLNGGGYVRSWMRGEDTVREDTRALYRRFFALWSAEENARG